MLFEDLGIKYFGPIDGHDINELISVFNNVSRLHGPLLLHVVTQKGKGVEHAEADPCKYHGVKPSKPEAQAEDAGPAPVAFTNVFGNAVLEYARANPKIIAITAAMTEGTGLVDFRRELPDQFFDVGIAEGHAVTFAGGLATEGFRPVCAIYSTFLQRAFDNLIHDIALQKLPVIFCLDRAGLAGEDGPTHHGVFDLSYLQMIPDAVVAAPKDGQELKNLLHTAFSHQNGPFFIRYPKENTLFASDIPGVEVPVGSWELLRKGKDIALLCVGPLAQNAAIIAEGLADHGIETELVNCRYIKPLDETMLAEIAGRFNNIITIEENTLQGGFGSTVSSFCQRHRESRHISFLHLGLPDNFITHGKRSQLLDIGGLSLPKLRAAIHEFLGIPATGKKTEAAFAAGTT